MGKLMLSVIVGVVVMHASDNGKTGDASALPRESRPVAAPTGKILWRTSLVALAVSDAVDVHSSWGRGELNPVLSSGGGQFGYQGALIKMGIQGGVIAVEYLMLHRRPSKGLYRAFSLVNFGGSSATGAAAIHNYRLTKR
jgi:hypothetical protein